MSFADWSSPLLLWLSQAAVGGTFFIAVLSRGGVDKRFFATHSLLLAAVWLAISCALGLGDNYLYIFSFIALVAAWSFRGGDITSGKNWLLLAAAFGGLFGLLRFVDVPENYSIWLKLWALVSVYIGVFTLGIIYLCLSIALAPEGWIEDPPYACRRALLPLEVTLFIRALYQLASLLAIPMIAERDGHDFLAAMTARPSLLAINWITGLLLPLMLMYQEDPAEPFNPREQQWRFLVLGFSCSLSVLIGGRLLL
jgi:hypothetical protein